MPNYRSETFGSGDQTWLANVPVAARDAITATLDVSAFTKATHYPDGYVPSGTPVNYADRGAVAPYTGAEGEALGFVFFDSKVFGEGASATAAPVSVLIRGVVKSGSVPGDFTAPAVAPSGLIFLEGE